MNRTAHFPGTLSAAAGGPHSAPVTHVGERILWTVVTLAALAGIYWLMWRGWRRRQDRQAGIAELPGVPAGVFPAAGAAGDGGSGDGGDTGDGAGIETVYISTTSEGDWLDRIAVHGLGERSNARVRVARAGVLVEREPSDVFIPAEAIRGVRPVTGMAGKYLRGEGIVVFTWQHGEHTLDTGLLPRYDADREALLASVRNLVNPRSERSAT
jgi:hypothetical protein